MKEWVKGCDMGFYVGQEVTGKYGEGFVVNIAKGQDYPIKVKHDEDIMSYKIDGCLYSFDKLPSLYPIELIPKFYQPEWKPKQGEWCWFWNEGSKCAIIGQFNYTHNGDTFGGLRYWAYGSHEFNFTNCAPFDKDNMTPPWERGEEK
jgi:hypothetical protein